MDMLGNFLKDCKVDYALGAVAAGVTDQDSAVVDMQENGGFDAIAAIGMLGDVLTTSVLSIELRESDNSDGSGSSLIAGSKTADFTADATSADSKAMISDACLHTKRYVFARVHRGTANAVVNGILLVRYKAHNRPITQPASVIASILANG